MPNAVTSNPLTHALVREAQTLLLSLLNNRLVGTYLIQDLRFVYVNEALAAMHGYTPQEMCAGMGPLDVMAPEHHELARQQFARRTRDDVGDASYVCRALRRDGTSFDAHVFGAATVFSGRPAVLGILLDVSEQHRAQRAVADQLRFLQQLLDAIPSPVFYKDEKGVYLGCNQAFEQFIGHPTADVVGRTVFDISPPELAARYYDADKALFDHPGRQLYEAGVRYADGSRHDVLFSKATFAKSDGSLGGLVGVMVDITESKRGERALRDAHARLALALEASQLSLWVLDIDADTISLDRGWTRILGAPPLDEVSMPTPEFIAAIEPDDRARLMRAVVAALKGATIGLEEEFRVKAYDGSWKWIRCTGKVTERDADGRALRALGTAQDITDRKASEQQIVHAAFNDWLTGLPNRFALTEHMAGALARARRNGTQIAVCMIDLDDFKPVNDAWGHAAGDRLLRELARRLRGAVRASDFLARLGGDEFVVVVGDLDEGHAGAELGIALDRVHKAVETPFDIGPHAPAHIGMSAGVALFPLDGDDADALLRQADVAMYRAKLHKLQRARWWNLGDRSRDIESAPEPAPEVFGIHASALLGRFGNLIGTSVDQYIDTFYAAKSPSAAHKAILDTVSPEDLPELRQHHAEHLRAILAPDAQPDAIREAAGRIGVVHALVGVSAPLLVASIELFRRLFGEQLNTATMPARDRYQLLAAVDARLQLQLQVQLEAGAAAMGRYLEVLSVEPPPQGTLWVDAVATELPRMGALDGVRGVLLMRLASNGVFAVEASAGPVAHEIAGVLQTPGSEAVVDPNSPRGQGLTAVAWRGARICSSPSYLNDPRYQAWRRRARELQLGSTMSVPVRNAIGQVVAVLSFFGAYPNQFESATMLQFARGLQQRWEQIWSHCTTPAPVVPEQRARALRERLFAGGLVMHVQPVVDLRSGQPVRVEALARLLQDDGGIVPPGEFLPLLGDAELDHVFRIGLDLVLTAINDLDQRGLPISASINLAPTTLLDPDCPLWVADALQRHGVAPHRLALELLETAEVDPRAQDEAIDQLLRLGVRLLMDDLGAGYSSLKRLSSLPFDGIKVDQSLTLNLRRTPLVTLPLMRSIVQLGRDLDRQVIVEGIEDRGMIEAASILGAAYGQGYAIARPMPVDRLLAWRDGFDLPLEPGAIHTFLGALAHHWLHAQQHGDGAGAMSLEACPVTAFLHRAGLTHDEAAEWHAACHQPHDRPAADQRFLRWLVGRVTAEGGT